MLNSAKLEKTLDVFNGSFSKYGWMENVWKYMGEINH